VTIVAEQGGAPQATPTPALPSPDLVTIAGRHADYAEVLACVHAESAPPRLRRPCGRDPFDKRPLRIVYLVPITGPGGGARVLFEHVNQLSAMGDEVTVVSHFDPPQWMECRARFVQVPFGQSLHHGIPDCDLIVAGFWDQILPARHAAIAPVVHFEQGPHHLFEEIDVQQLVAAAASVRAADATMAVGKGGAEALVERFGVESVLVPNAVDCERFSPQPSAPRRSVLFVGPDGSPFKGIDLARRIAAGLAASHPEVEIVWVTPRPPADGAFGRVVVDPSQQQLAQLYREALVYVCTSRFETWGLPALEAMASGTPVVSAAHGGIVTFARDGDNALLGAVDDADGLLAITRRVLDDSELATRLARSGLHTARETTWTKVMRDVRAFFVDTLERFCFEDGGDGGGDEGAALAPGIEPAQAAGTPARTSRHGRGGAQPLGGVELRLGDLVIDDALGIARLHAYARSCPTAELALPVSRPVRGALRRVSWEVVARRSGAPAGVTRLYLPARSAACGELPEELFGLLLLADGDYQGALATLLPELQQAAAGTEATLSRWVITALLGLGRSREALDLAVAGCERYLTQPDFFALAFIAATSAGVPIDHEATMHSVRLLGNGSRHDEWFDDPLGLMRAHLLGTLGL
jgi:glycosyltransferase involved in cell wall biosynthesis